MLSKMSLESAGQLAELMIDVKGKIVECKDGTPVEKLVELAEPISEKDLKPTTVSAAIESLEASTYTPVASTAFTHDDAVEDLSTKIANLMNRRIHLARNVVNPLINRYVELMEGVLAGVVPSQPEVNEVDFGEFYSHPLVGSIFNGYYLDTLDEIDGVKGYAPSEENNYYSEALSTGSDFIDEKLASILSERGEEWYRNVVTRYFENGEPLAVMGLGIHPSTNEEADKNLIIHMVARYLYSHEIEPIRETDQDSKQQLLYLLGRSAQNLKALLEKKANIEENDVVTEDISKESHVVYVYKPTYDNFIQRGGNNTMLMGYLRRERGRLSGQEIINKGPALESVYDKEINAEVKSLGHRRQELLIRAAQKGLGEIINGIPADVLATIPALNQVEDHSAVQVLVLRGQDWISENPQAAGDNIWSYASDIILKGLLPELELDIFYSIMSRHLKPSESGLTLTPQQAAYYAAVEEIVKYLVSQTDAKQAKTVSLEKNK